LSSPLLNPLAYHTAQVDILPGIDGVRALAVLLVFAFHAHAFAGAPDLSVFGGVHLTPWLSRGFLGAQLFFVLSGFLLMLPWAKAHYYQKRSPSIGDFLGRRLLRIVPAYYVHLAVLFLTLVPAVHSYHFLLSPDGRWNILAHLSLTQFLFPSTATGAGINGALWTLSIEAQFYLLLPLVARLFLGRRWLIGLLLALTVSMLWRYLSAHQLLNIALQLGLSSHATFYEPTTGAAAEFTPFLTQMFLMNQFPAQAFHFAVGMAAASFYIRTRASGRLTAMGGLSGTAFAGLSALSVLYVAGAFPLLDPASWSSGLWYVLDAVADGFLVLASAYPNPISAVLGHPVLRAVGITSYGIYLWHVPVCFLVSHYFIPPGIDPVDAFYAIVAAGGIISLAIACLSYLYVERPFLDRRRLPRRERRNYRLSTGPGHTQSAPAGGGD
jgi:peptidoglycan/LPS O-acetylase OafA/YrhL